MTYETERQPNYDNVLFMDEYPDIIERRRVKVALGQLTLAINTDPGQLFLFPESDFVPDQPA